MAVITRRRFLAGSTVLGTGMPRLARASTQRVVRIGHNSVDDSNFDQGCKALAAAVAADPVLSPVLRIETYGYAELGDELAGLQGIAQGTVDMVLCATGTAGYFAPSAALLDTPFLFMTVERARAALDGPIGAELAEILKPKGLNVLAWGESGLRHITANRPVRTPADLHGLKLRVTQSAVELASFRALGADPQQLSFGEVYEALRTGRCDGQENPITVIEENKLQQVQKYLSLTGHIYSPIYVLASSDLMDDLSPAQRTALTACAKQGGVKTRQVAEISQLDGVKRLAAAGMTVVQDVDIPGFIAAAKPIQDALGQTYGADLMRRLAAAGA